MAYRQQKLLQKLSLAIGGLFFAFIVGGLIFRSFDAPGVALLSDDIATEGLNIAKNLGEATGTELHLQDFHRVEVKDGRPVWEIKAKDAKYYTDQGVTLVTDAEVIIYERKGPPVSLRAKTAKLFLKNSVMEKAELEGEIVVSRAEQVTVKTNIASYYSKSGKVVAPGAVEIIGKGYRIKGVGMEMFIDREDITLTSAVESSFLKVDPAPAG